MKKLLYKWIDVPAEIHEEVTNKRDYIQSEVFEDPYDITDFYADQGGVTLAPVERDIYEYINDNGDKRIVEIMDITEVEA